MFVVRRATKEFCATIREISDENSRLKAENERLQSENSRLREFVTSIMHYAKYSNPDCRLCNHYNECWADDALSLPTGCIICNEARELGIEEDW